MTWMRTALYLPTLTAIRFNPVLRAFFERLLKAGKPRMQAVGACMRKLVMICFGVLKNRTPFDPAWNSRKIGCHHATWFGPAKSAFSATAANVDPHLLVPAGGAGLLGSLDAAGDEVWSAVAVRVRQASAGGLPAIVIGDEQL